MTYSNGNAPFAPYMNGGSHYGGHWPTSSQIHGSSIGYPNQGPIAFSACSTSTFIAAQQAALSAAYAVEEESCTQPIENAGIRLGEVIAWRCWRVEHGWLYSMVNDKCEWEPGKVIEAHKMGTCAGEGVHAFKNRKRAISYGNVSSATVVGRVALWGEIYEFEEGWHGEFARIVSLDYYQRGYEPTGHQVYGYFVSEWQKKRRRWFSRRRKPAPPDPLTELRKTYGLTDDN